MDNGMAMPMTGEQDHPDIRGNDPLLGDYDTIVLDLFQIPDHVWLTEPDNTSSHNSNDVVPNIHNNPIPTQDMCFTEPKFRFPILSLPAEIRVIVYRSLWTLPVERGLTTALESLALTCCKIRNGVLHEYITHIFPFTQIHLGSKRRVLKGLRASSLLTQHVKHVSLLWGRCVCAEDGDIVQRGNHPGGLRWLVKLQQLKTLELVFTDPRYNDMQRFTRSGLALPAPGVAEEDSDEEDGDDEEFVNWVCFDCWDLLMGLPHTLEKVVFRVWCADDDKETAAPAVRETWEVTEWFRRMKVQEERYQRSRHMNVEDGVEEAAVVEEEVEDVNQNQEPQTYQIVHHVGDLDVKWPLSDTI